MKEKKRKRSKSKKHGRKARIIKPTIRSVDVVEQAGEDVFSYVLLVLEGLLELVVMVLRLVVVVEPVVVVELVVMAVVGPVVLVDLLVMAVVLLDFVMLVRLVGIVEAAAEVVEFVAVIVVVLVGIVVVVVGIVEQAKT